MADTCETCRFWDSSTQRVNAQPDTTGACRRQAPLADFRTAEAFWPFSADDDWCGEHQPRESDLGDEEPF